MKFSSNRNISGNKFKPFPVISADMRKEKHIQAVYAAGPSCLRDIGESHYVINQHYVKKFRKDFGHNEIIYETDGGNYKISTISRFISQYQNFLNHK